MLVDRCGGHLHHLEADAGDIADGVAAATEAGDQHLALKRWREAGEQGREWVSARDRRSQVELRHRHLERIAGSPGPALFSAPSLVVLIDEVQAAVPGHEGGDLLAVLDELHAAALTDGRVRLLRLDADLLDDDALGVGGASEGVALVLGAQVGLLVVLVRPQLRAAAVHQLARAADSTRLGGAHCACRGGCLGGGGGGGPSLLA